MLMRDPGLVQKKTLDEYLGPWMCKGVEQVPGSLQDFAGITNQNP